MSFPASSGRHIVNHILIRVNMPIRKKSREELDRLAIARQLLKLEPLGVLSREICPFPVPTDGEIISGPSVLPPRLFYFPRIHALIHCYGDEAFYEQNPAYAKGGVSKECYVLDHFPDFLSNQFALEDMLNPGISAFPYEDILSMAARRPKPLTREEQKARVKEYNLRKKARCSVLHSVK